MKYPKEFSCIESHPRILFSKQEIDKINTSSAVEEFFSLADRYADERQFAVKYPMIQFEITVDLPLVALDPLPEAEGYVDFPYWTMYSRAIEERMTVLSTAYALTEQDKYGQKVKEYLLALAKFPKWYEFPHRGAEGNLSNAHFTLAAAIGYDSIYSLLDEDEREEVRLAMLEKGLKPFEIDFDNQDSHNIIASKRVAMMIGALSILGEKEVGKYVSNAYEYLFSYLEDRSASPEIEGLLYTSVAIRHIWMAADALYRATGDETLVRHPYFDTFLPELFLYMMGNEVKQTFVNFSDSFYKLDISFLMGMLAQRNQHPVASWYVRKAETESKHILLNPDAMPEPIAPGDFFVEENSKVFPTIGWAAFRSGWDRKDHLLAFSSSGSAKNHNHFDQNNFVLHVHDEWLITNPGYQDYVEGPRNEFTLGTIGHNALLVNGKGQQVLGNSRIADWFLSPSFDYCAGDATGAYSGTVKKWLRHILHIDQSYFILIDQVEKDSPDDELSFLYHTTSKPVTEGRELNVNDSIYGDQVDFEGAEASVSLYHCYPSTAEKTLDQYPGAEEYGTYVTVKPEAGLESETVLTLIVPHALKPLQGQTCGYDVHCKEEMISLKIDRVDGRLEDYLLFSKNQAIHMVSKQGDFSAKGEQAWACVDKQLEQPVKVMLLKGHEVSYQGKSFIEADHKLNAFIETDGPSVQYEIETERDTKIQIPCMPSSCVMVNGQSLEGRTTGKAELLLAGGKHVITVKQQD